MKILPDNMNRSSKRRKRTVLSAKQHRILSKFFLECAFPDAEQRMRLGKVLEMTPRTVQIWFQNQRQKIRTNIGDQKSSFDFDEESINENMEIPTPKASSNCKSLLALANAACIEYNRRFGNSEHKNSKQDFQNNNTN